MSTQPFSSLSENPTPLTTEAAEEHREQHKSLLDEPWKVTPIPAAATAQPVNDGPTGEPRMRRRGGEPRIYRGFTRMSADQKEKLAAN